MQTQYVKILKRLFGNGSISSSEAKRMGIRNLRARVCEMRDRGHLIMTHRKGQKASYKFFQREDYYA